MPDGVAAAVKILNSWSDFAELDKNGIKIDFGELGNIKDITKKDGRTIVQPLDSDPQLEPLPGQNPRRDEITNQPNCARQRALVMTAASLNEQFVALYKQEEGARTLYYTSADDGIEAKLNPFKIIISRRSAQEPSKLYLVLSFESGIIQPMEIHVSGWELAFPCRLAKVGAPVSGYATQYVLRLLTSVMSARFDHYHSSFGKNAANESIKFDKWKEGDMGSRHYLNLSKFFENMMNENQRRGRTRLGFQIDYDLSKQWKPSGATKLCLFNPRRTPGATPDYADDDYVMWLESETATESNIELGDIFARNLAAQVKSSRKNFYGEKHPLDREMVKSTVADLGNRLWFQPVNNVAQFDFWLRNVGVDNFIWNTDKSSDGEIERINTWRRVTQSAPDVPVEFKLNRTGMLIDEGKRGPMGGFVYKRPIATIVSAVDIWPIEQAKCGFKHVFTAQFSWSYYLADNRADPKTPIQAYQQAFAKVIMSVEDTIGWKGKEAVVETHKLNNPGVAKSAVWNPEYAQMIDISSEKFKSVYEEEANRVGSIVRDLWGKQSFLDVPKIKDWLSRSGVTVSNENDLGKPDEVLRGVYPAVSQIVPSAKIKVLGQAKVEIKPDTANKDDAGTKTSEATNGDLSVWTLSTLRGRALKSNVVFGKPDKILPGTIIDITVTFEPKDTNVLYFRYIEIQFRASQKGKQLFVEANGVIISATASIESLHNTDNSFTAPDNPLKTWVKSLRGIMGYAVHVVGPRAKNNTDMLTINKGGDADKLNVSMIGKTNSMPGTYDMVVVESLVNDQGEILERTEGMYPISVVAA